MTTPNLPVHLANRQQRQLVDNAFAGMAGALPPHISIKSNRFTLVGSDSARQTLDTTSIYACFVDVSEAIGKLYYAYDYQDGSDDPPTCWSSNGIAPSREASERQARTCAECQWNVRGSDTSKLSGKAIKACRDEKWTAVTLANVQVNPQGQVVSMAPLYPEVLWQFRITPGSFKNWRGFVERCKSQGVDMSLLVTRIAFEADKNGVLTFQPVTWIDTALADIRDKAWESGVTDALVGRGDAPAALEAPAASPLPVPNAGLQLTDTAPAPIQTANPAPAASPSNPPARRPRRTKAEMEAARAGGNGVAQPQGQPIAPFRPEAQQAVNAGTTNASTATQATLNAGMANAPFPAAQPAQQPSFGIQQPAAMPDNLNAALDDFFGPQK